MQYLVLGPVEVVSDGGPVPVGSPKERRLLALLLARRGEVVSAEVLIDGREYLAHLYTTLQATAADDLVCLTGLEGDADERLAVWVPETRSSVL